MTQGDSDESTRKTGSGFGVSRFFVWYGNRKRKAILDDAQLTLRQYLLKIGMIFVFILIDLIFFPSLIQNFIPISTDFFLVWVAAGLFIVLAEKKTLDRILSSRKIVSSYR